MASGVHNLLIYYRFCRPGGPLAAVIKEDVIIGSEATPDAAAVTRQLIFHWPLAFSPQWGPDGGYLGAGPLRNPPWEASGGSPAELCTCQAGPGRAGGRGPGLGQPPGRLGWQDDRLVTSGGCSSSRDTHCLLKAAASGAHVSLTGNMTGESKDLGSSAEQRRTR